MAEEKDTKTTEETAAATADADVVTVKSETVDEAPAIAQAPANLFNKAVVADADSNPDRVKMITAAVTAYAADCGRTQGDAGIRRMLSLDLMRAIRLMATLNYTDYLSVADVVVSTIAQTTNEAFHPRYLLMFADELAGREKDRFMLPITAFTQYARLKNKSMLRQRVDVSAVSALMQTDGAKNAVEAFFPK